MSDTKGNERQHSLRIDVKDGDQLQYWSEKFGVSVDELKHAVTKAGVYIDAVEEYLKNKSR